MRYGILRPNEHGQAWPAPLEFMHDSVRYLVKPEGIALPLDVARHGLVSLTPKDPFEMLPALVDLETVEGELALTPVEPPKHACPVCKGEFTASELGAHVRDCALSSVKAKGRKEPEPGPVPEPGA